MSAWLFVETGKSNDAASLAALLGIDAATARQRLLAKAPLAVRRDGDPAAAQELARRLTASAFESSAHDDADVAALPAAVECVAIAPGGGPELALVAESGERIALPPASCVLHARLVVELSEADPNVFVALLGQSPLHVLGLTPPSLEQRKPIAFRMEVFAETADGNVVRAGARHDRFDFAGLGAAKTLSAVRNLEALAKRLAGAAQFDDAFPRTDLARRLERDVWMHYGVSAAAMPLTARTNRSALDLYARLRFLHARRRRPETRDHYLEP